MPISKLLAEAHVRNQTARLLRHKQRSSWPQYLFHFTHVTNAVNILKYGYLASRSSVGNFHDVANQGALNAYTASHDYARLYFRPKNGFHIRTEGIKCISDPYRQDNQASVPVALLFDFTRTITKTGVVFTAGNIQRTINVELDGDQAFRSLDFESIYHDDYVTSDNKDHIIDRRMAEVMVPEYLPLADTLKLLVFRTNLDLETFESMLSENGVSCEFKTAVEQVHSSIFMHWGLYISELNFTDTRLILRFHFPRNKPANNMYSVRIIQHTSNGIERTLNEALALTNSVLTVTNFAPDPAATWEIHLEGVLAFRGKLAHARSQVFG